MALKDIDVQTHIGVPDIERKTEQQILVSLEIFHPIAPVAKGDDLEQGIDYAAVTQDITELGKQERKTIERFAEDIATMILTKHKPEGGVRVTVTKMPDLLLESASVTIRRP